MADLGNFPRCNLEHATFWNVMLTTPFKSPHMQYVTSSTYLIPLRAYMYYLTKQILLMVSI